MGALESIFFLSHDALKVGKKNHSNEIEKQTKTSRLRVLVGGVDDKNDF